MPRILVVDDQKENLLLTAHTLRSYLEDTETVEFTDGLAALEKALEPEQSFDLIITDVKMPRTDGFELCLEYKRRCKEPVPVLMLSGVYVGGSDRARGFENGADGYLCKPYRLDELIAQVRVLLRIRSTEKALREHEALLERELQRRTGDLNVSERKFQELFAGSPDGILVLNEDAIIDQANPAAAGLLSMREIDLEGLSAIGLVEKEQQSELLSQLETLKSGAGISMEVDFLNEGGKRVPVELVGQFLEGAGEEKAAMILHLRDISRRREMEQQMQQKQMLQALGRLTGGVAHDFNNLLTSILGFSHIIRDEMPEGSELQADVDKIVHSAEEASKLTRKLMLFGQRQILPQHPVDLNAVLRGADQLLRRLIGENIELVTLFGENIGYVESDEQLIEHVIYELAANGRDAMRGGGKIVLQTCRVDFSEADAKIHPDARSGVYNVLSVTDEGTGIPEEIRKNIFEPFFSTKRMETRTSGMGLATVYGIVQRSGGFVNVVSQESRGTRVDVYFPVMKNIRRQSSLIGNNPIPTGEGETILVVEDEDQVLRLCKRILDQLGYQVLHARNGTEALRVSDQYNGKIDLVLTDVVMPHMGGVELVDELGKLRPAAKVLFTSGYTNQPLSKHGDTTPPFIMKPYTRDALARKVREVLDTQESQPSVHG